MKRISSFVCLFVLPICLVVKLNNNRKRGIKKKKKNGGCDQNIHDSTIHYREQTQLFDWLMAGLCPQLKAIHQTQLQAIPFSSFHVFFIFIFVFLLFFGSNHEFTLKIHRRELSISPISMETDEYGSA